VHGVLALALTLLLGPPASAEPPVSEPSEEQCRASGQDFFYGLGPADAPTLLRMYTDPIAADTAPLRMWLEVRRIAGERGAELRVELVPTRGGLAGPDPEGDVVRVWFMAAASLGKGEEALRVLDRWGDWSRLAAQLRSEEGRARLAEELGLEADAIEARRTGSAGACLRRSLAREANHYAAQTMGQRSSLVGVIGRDGVEEFTAVDVELSELRAQIDRMSTIPSFVDQATAYVPYMPPMTGRTSRFDRTFPQTGVLVGGDALPHRLVIFVEDEENGRLSDWLRPAMEFRSQQPGQLSVQVIASGVGTRAISLRRRLCAARALGLEVEYLLHLSEAATIRRLHETELYEVLQPVADSDSCSDSEPLEPIDESDAAASSRRLGEFGSQRGAWLDGRPVNPSDLESLEWQLRSEVAPSIIDWLLTPDSSIAAGPVGGFEF
jgi:hypothetical protein